MSSRHLKLQTEIKFNLRLRAFLDLLSVKFLIEEKFIRRAMLSVHWSLEWLQNLFVSTGGKGLVPKIILIEK